MTTIQNTVILEARNATFVRHRVGLGVRWDRESSIKLKITEEMVSLCKNR
jgi:hypothetical protein